MTLPLRAASSLWKWTQSQSNYSKVVQSLVVPRQYRSLSSTKGRHRRSAMRVQRKRPEIAKSQLTKGSSAVKRSRATTSPSSSSKVAATEASSSSSSVQPTALSWMERLTQYVRPYRFHSSGNTYTLEQLITAVKRLPYWLALVFLMLWEQTSPFNILTIHGPSMIPTMASDGSEIWLVLNRSWLSLVSLGGGSSLAQPGDLVGFSHPDTPHYVSCKRVIGVAGSRVRRYGQYISLYIDQDPVHWGQPLPPAGDGVHDWIDRSYGWDDRNYCEADRRMESLRTLAVPTRHVWLESDCPALGIDSRQHGPVPEDWLRGKVVARLWPSWPRSSPVTSRPHPIPLNPENLAKHNVHLF